MSWAVAMTSLFTSAAKIASKPASSASRATAWISLARQPVPGMTASPSRLAMGGLLSSEADGALARAHLALRPPARRDDCWATMQSATALRGPRSRAIVRRQLVRVKGYRASALHEEDQRGDAQEREDHATEPCRVELAEEGYPHRHADEGGGGEDGGRLPDVGRHQAGPPIAHQDHGLVHHEEAGDVGLEAARTPVLCARIHDDGRTWRPQGCSDDP